MSNLAKVIPIRPNLTVVEGRVADLDDGFTRLANELYEELIAVNLTKTQSKVAHAYCRKTYGYNKKVDRIADSQIAEMCRITRSKANTAKNELIAMNVLIKVGNKIGINKNLSEWVIPESSQIGNIVPKKGTNKVPKLETRVSPVREHTKDTIQNTIKTNTPNPLTGVAESVNKESKKTKSQPTPYQAVMDAYNQAAGDKLPNAEKLNDKRKRAIKRLLGELKEPTAEAAGKYFRAFVNDAKPFYFGDSPSGWVADFDYVLRSTTLTKTREGSL